MIPVYNCGFYLGYLRQLKKKLESVAKFNIDFILKNLCTFTCEEIIQSNDSLNISINELKLISVFENIICRGLPTYPSLFVERTLLNFVCHDILICEETETGSFLFFHKDLNRKKEEEWLKQLINVHCVIEPRWGPERELAYNPFDSEEEKYFFYRLLPFIGENSIQMFEPQRTFDSLIPPSQAINFIDQRVDFTIETQKIKAIVEIDGEPRDRVLDQKRNDILKNNGWSVTRIPTSILKEKVVENILLDLKEKLEKDEYFVQSRENYKSFFIENRLYNHALQLVLTPFTIARLQKVLLMALRNSVISINQGEWRFVVIERDIPCGTLAIIDFLKTLKALYRLLEIEIKLPKVYLLIYKTREFEKFQNGISNDLLLEYNISLEEKIFEEQYSEDFRGNILIDISILQRYGLTKPDMSFCNQHLLNTGIAYSIRSAHRLIENRRCSASTGPIKYPINSDKNEPLKYFLQNIFRKIDFWEGQFEILERSLSLKPVIGLLPTGAGKSLCYQLSSLLQPGTTLVVDPLCSLMFDQYDNLIKMGIDNVQFVNSEQSAAERDQIIKRMGNGEFQMVFVSPERMQIKEFRNRLQQLTTAFPVPYVVIDEAHCVSEWGHDFRTSYLNLARTVQKCCRRDTILPTIIALTGTASFSVLTDVQREIGIDDEESKIYPKSFDRKELIFNIEVVSSNQKRTKLLGILNDLPNRLNINPSRFFETINENTQSGLIFTLHVNGYFGVFDICNWLKQELNIRIEYYSGEAPKLSDMNNTVFNEYKRRVQEGFKNNDFPLLLCTKAFGMGIDKPNIRYTIHFGIPQSLEAFYQEAGRAGRDRKKSICTIIYSDDNPLNANQFLDSTQIIDNLKSIPMPTRSFVGDIHRLMYFQQKSFQGIVSENNSILELLNNYIYHCLDAIQINCPKEILIPFGNTDEKNAREKSIYRLSIIGIIKDYTIDYNGRKFEVEIEKKEEFVYLRNLQSYIALYETKEYVDDVPNKINQKKGRNKIEKCLGFLIEFVYEKIEKKRRMAIQQMAEVARTCHSDSEIRKELLAYLEKSEFTEILLKLTKRIEPTDWWSILDQVSDVDKAHQLIGGCRRTLESSSNHPGLHILSGLARMLLPNPDEKSIDDYINTGLTCLKQELIDNISKQEEIVLQFIEKLDLPQFRVQKNNILKLILNEFPTRSIARLLYVNNEYSKVCKNIILNSILKELKQFNQNLLR